MAHPRPPRTVGATRPAPKDDPAWGPMLACSDCGELYYFALSPDLDRCEWCAELRVTVVGGWSP